jgi:hypothetical protein
MTFTKILPDDPKRLIAIAKTAIQKAGGAITGNERAGEFCGKTPVGAIGGTYKISDNVLTVTLLKKPMLLSEERIRGAFNRYFTV